VELAPGGADAARLRSPCCCLAGGGLERIRQQTMWYAAKRPTKPDWGKLVSPPAAVHSPGLCNIQTRLTVLRNTRGWSKYATKIGPITMQPTRKCGLSCIVPAWPTPRSSFGRRHGWRKKAVARKTGAGALVRPQAHQPTLAPFEKNLRDRRHANLTRALQSVSSRQF
jgi:hypothetical protein